MAQINLIGKTILGYIVKEKLGAGAFGTVYKVVKTNASGQYVRALKHITIPTEKQYYSVLNSMGGDVSKADNYFEKMLRNIVSEIRILNDLSEKGVQNIVRYYENDIEETDSPKRYDIYILMEHLTPLEDYIKNKNFTVQNVVKLGLDVLSGLQSCHLNDVIHRDIKDENIFVSDKGEYKIGDFGVSKILKDSSKAESLKGTPNFLAPEVYMGKDSYTKSVDLYSLGIVLYRLLNYERNPFLPKFPEQYFEQDEDMAFNMRMRGDIPEIPLLGGEYIGKVIVKAISGKMERFQDVEEFKSALEWAVSNTPADVLDESIKFVPSEYNEFNEDVSKEKYTATLGENASNTITDRRIDYEHERSINRHLFDSIGEIPNMEAPEIESIINREQEIKKGTYQSEKREYEKEKVVNVVPPVVEEDKEIPAVDRKTKNKIVFAIPIILCLIGIIAYFVIVPNIYGKVISFTDWLFTDPQNIIDTLRNPNAVLPQVGSIVGMRVFWWCWTAALTGSLFFVGKQLQAKPEAEAANAVLTGKEPYLLMQDINSTLKQLKMRTGTKQLDGLMYVTKKLEEKLAVESDFGCGKESVIHCENEIAKQIQFLSDTLPYIEKGDMDDNIKNLNIAVTNIDSLLRKRIQLKKR